MKTKRQTYSLTKDGILPFLAFPDLEVYLDSLSLKQLNEWNDKLSQKEANAEIIHAAMALYLMETGGDNIELTEKKIKEIYTSFSISIGLYHNIRIGHIRKTKGRLTLINSTANFQMTDKGIKHVENNLLRK